MSEGVERHDRPECPSLSRLLWQTIPVARPTLRAEQDDVSLALAYIRALLADTERDWRAA
ncbi:hypothetical protein [Streptomyces sp.]|uniref:hypothetical protein n=1 Tax=Streptomyces sp. TaxID=1931 RepID=UPI002811F258|nr:hypothetical protein [Streptomyces sp.]